MRTRRAGRRPPAVLALALLILGGTSLSSASGNDPAAAGDAPQGYWLAGEDGAVHAFGDARPHGSISGLPPGRAVIGLGPTPSGGGYWLVTADGGVFAFGDAEFFGSTGGITLNRPVVGMAPTPTGNGYWLVASDGGIFAFGDARFYGSMGGRPLNKPIVGMAASPTGNGYWFVAADGGIFAFGDARFYGSAGNLRLNKPIVGMAPAPSGSGYWFVASDGGIFAYGGAGFWGSTGNLRLRQPIVGMAPTATGRGYWFVAADGGVFNFGDAEFRGSTGNRALSRPIMAMAGLPAGQTVSANQAPPPAPADTTDTTATDPVDPNLDRMRRPPVPPPPVVATPFDIALVGDTGYTASQVDSFEEVREDINRHPLAFVVHDGDIWSEGAACTDGAYLEVRDTFNGFAHPFVYTPGDNEWADCGGSTKLRTIRRLFFDTDETLGQRRMTVARQHPDFVENARWTHGGVVFATINEPGASGRGGSHRDMNIEWLHAAFDQAEATGAPGVMIIWQDNPFEPSGGRLARVLEERTVAFGKPVVLVHGDTHQFRINHPWSDVPNFTRVETFGDTSSARWVRAIVDPASPEVFSFEVMRA